MKEYMPKGGVNELLKSGSGREYLAELQQRHRIDILQERNPDGSRNHEFDKVYGKQRERDKKLREKNEQISKDMWAEREERKKFIAKGDTKDWKKKAL